MEMSVETATMGLLDKLVEIEEQCFSQEAFTKRQISYLLTDHNTIALVAKANGEVAGFIIAQIEIEDGRLFGHILTINTALFFRKKGIARKMLQEIETILRKKGIRECRLEVREDNSGALELYFKNGYLKIGRLDRYYGKTHGLYFRKSL